MARARARPPSPPIARAMLLHVRRSGWRYRPRMAWTKPAASMIRTTTSPNAAMPSNVPVTETAPRLPAMAPIRTRAKHASTPRKPLRISLVEVSTALGLPGSSRGLRFAAAVSRCALLGAWATCTTALLEVHAPGRIRTSDQQLRRLLLYPPELRARVIRQQLNTRVRLAARSRALLARRLDIVSILLHAHATLARSCDGGHSSCIRR